MAAVAVAAAAATAPGGTVGPGGGDPGPSGSGGRGEGVKPGAEDDDETHSGGVADDRKPMEGTEDRNADGSPTDSNPGLTIADFGPAPIGVPNFVIDQFTIPPFLLPIYQACGTEYGVPWQVLASINRIETAFGTNLNVSSAGALGWMQFMPASWEAYGVDANNDGRKDPYNPVDAICAAGRYLKAAGAEEDLRTAIFAYNHADWYVDEVILYANQYSKLPDDLVGSLTGLTEGARFPVAAKARYADDISERRALERSKPGKRGAGNVAEVISSSPTRRGIDIFAREGAPVVAVNDGVITDIGKSKKLGRYMTLRDAYGNRFTYAQLGEVADVYPVQKKKKLSAADFELVSPDADGKPDAPASAGDNGAEKKAAAKAAEQANAVAAAEKAAANAGLSNTEDSRDRLYAFPERANNADRAGLTGQLDKLMKDEMPGYESFKSYFSSALRFDRKTMELKPLKEGSKVIAGTVLGEVGQTEAGVAPHVHFAIRPAGRGAPKIDPKPILDGWKLLEATAIYRAAGKNPFLGGASTGQVLLMSKSQLIRRVLADPALEIYSCGREDIRNGAIDRRILALMEYLVARGFRLTDHLAHLRPRLLHRLRQRQPPLLRQRDRHRPDQRHPGYRQPGRGLDHRGARARRDAAPRLDGTGPDHLPDGLRSRQHLRHGRPRRSRARRLHAALRPQRRHRLAAVHPDPQGRSVAAPDRPSRRDREPDRAHLAVGVRDPDEQAQGRDRKQGPEVGQGQQARPRFQRPHRRVARRRRAFYSVSAVAGPQRFPFVQFDLAGTVGLEDGRYLGREPERVLVVRVSGLPAPRRRRLRRAKPTEAQPGARVETVPLTSLTAIRPESLGDEDAASRLARDLARRLRRRWRRRSPTPCC